MTRETRPDHVEEAAEHAERSVDHREEERRLEGQAQATSGRKERKLEHDAHEHHEAAEREEDAASDDAS
jgi:hypothetical protein